MKKNIKKGLIISSCLLMCFSAVGCGKKNVNTNKENNKNTENIMDVRTAKIVNQQQAILQFTTANKAGSVISIELVPSNKKKYTYTLDVVDKKGVEYIYTIDAKSGNVSNKEEKGTIDKANQPEYIDFVPVLDIEKAGKAAIHLAKNPDFNQVLSYKLYSDGGKNIYQITLTNGDEGDSAKTEKILIDAVTGKKLAKDEIKKAEENKKEEDAKKAAEK